MRSSISIKFTMRSTGFTRSQITYQLILYAYFISLPLIERCGLQTLIIMFLNAVMSEVDLDIS